MIERYILEVNRPAACSVSLMKEHIHDAVRSWGGQYHPEHPLSEKMDVVVKRLNEGDR